LCQGCPHRSVFGALHNLDCIVASDIGCYTLAVLPPFEAADTCVCMGRVSAWDWDSGTCYRQSKPAALSALWVTAPSSIAESRAWSKMVYNPPKTGHLVIILDNGTTAMTGLQEHPGTGRTLDHQPTGKVVIEDLVRSLGIAAGARD